jgi:hypothetical protein
LTRFGYKSFRDQVAAVLQDDSLFAGSLADNIALFDDAPDMERIVEAAQAASIHDDIARMPMVYERCGRHGFRHCLADRSSACCWRAHSIAVPSCSLWTKARPSSTWRTSSDQSSGDGGMGSRA